MPPKRRRAPPRPNPIAPTQDISKESRDGLARLSVAEIKAYLRSLALSPSGPKKVLVNRLYEHFHSPDNHQTGDSSANSSSSSGHHIPPGDLQATITRLVWRGIREALQTQRPATNISTPSPPSQAGSQSPPSDTNHPGAGGGPSLLPTTPVPNQSQAGPSKEIDLPPVPSAIRSKIEKGEYIDFNSLLQENMYPTPSNDSAYTLSVRPDPDTVSQGVVISQAKQKRLMISDLSAWLQAWNIFALLVVHKEPDKAMDLLCYQRFVCDVSTRSRGFCTIRSFAWQLQPTLTCHGARRIQSYG